jgi:type IV pilus assembly protein PilY1
MFNISVKSNWVGITISAVVLAILVKFALAITAFTPQGQPTGYVAQNEVSSYFLNSGTEILFRPEYQREYWSGNLYAYPLNTAGVANTAAEWWTGGAAVHIDAQNYDTGRLIATMKDDGTPIAFRYTNLSATQQGYLGSSTVLDFLRGKRSDELQNGGTLRQRESALGDIIHSRPFYIEDTTNPTIFVGANDGMLHAINAGKDSSGGEERWAYVPSMLLGKMVNLSISPYVHDYFVDGQINISTILSGTKRVLVGALGAGGKGLYALNITGSSGLAASNEAGVASKVMWEITPSKVNYANPVTANAYINLGYTYGTPTIAKVGVTDAVIIGNGYNDNATGDYQAYLYVINADTGQRISAIKAGTSGNAASPNGLSTPVAIDVDNDGSSDIAYAGDLNGTLWKFDLSAGTATALYVTSPAQPITATPAVASHPNGGFMVNFATGAMFTTADTLDTAVHYVYGIWDGATGSSMVTQTLTERVFGSERVRRVSANAMNWATDKGWKVALPFTGEKVVGDGSYILNGRFFFSTHNPTVFIYISSTQVWGENWLMELDFLSGGTKNLPFLDLNLDSLIDDNDRILYISSDTKPGGSVDGDPIMTTDGIPVGKFVTNGVMSQPILVQLNTLNNTVFNSNPDITVPTVILERGVSGGHFDVDIYYGTMAGGTQATATITVSSTGSSYPATLGDITVGGVTIVPALTTADIVNGTATTTNATKIRDKINATTATTGFSATVSSNVVTVKAPAGSSYNLSTFSIAAGTSSVGSPPTSPSAGTLVMTAIGKSKSVSLTCGGTDVGSAPWTSSNSNTAATRLDALYTTIHGTSLNGYGVSCVKGGGPTTSLTCTITAPAGLSACSTGFSVDSDITVSTNTGPSGGANATGWSDLAPALAGSSFSGGVDGTSGDTCSSGTAKCTSKGHVHEYDDIYDKTGVNYLDSSTITHDLANAIPSTTTQFKVLAQNQYLSPAVSLHIGDASYVYNINAGYVALKNYQTTGSVGTPLDLSTVPTYTRATVGSLAINMPSDAFTPKDWWGGVNGLPYDKRVGLHPTQTGCVKSSASATQDGNMYQPVIPPSGVTADGNGTLGYSGSTTQNTATGVRHNGALIIQVISASTPQADIEMSVPNKPEYGWRVKASKYSNWVLAEYTTFWHEKLIGACYGATGWTKLAPTDNRTCGSSDTTTTRKCATEKPATDGTDPKIGGFGTGANLTSTTKNVVGNVTTTTYTYDDGSTIVVVKTKNSDGTVITCITDGNGTTCSTTADTLGRLPPVPPQTDNNPITGRISWRELVRE